MAAVTAFFYALDDDGVVASHVLVPPNTHSVRESGLVPPLPRTG
jgi:hypothetical protein